MRPKLISGVLVLGCILLAVGCGGGDGGGGDDGGNRSTQAVDWVVVRELGPRVAKLATRVDQCEGDPYPTFEEPVVEYSGRKVYIELLVASAEAERDGDCQLLTVGVQTSVALKRDLDELVLYDASTDPPERRWPE